MKNTIEFNHDLDQQNMSDKMPYIMTEYEESIYTDLMKKQVYNNNKIWLYTILK